MHADAATAGAHVARRVLDLPEPEEWMRWQLASGESKETLAGILESRNILTSSTAPHKGIISIFG
jgi:hypothetical protein